MSPGAGIRSSDGPPAPSSDVIARRYIVHGRVQGVGFRYFVAGEAHKLGIAGWVRNNINGTVEALAAGSSENLSRFHESLRRGPRAARVDRVEVFSAPAEGLKGTFRIEGSW
ncbi:MAG TPA: acylphosphatase [Terriglobales bacterium]|nr:acylphosphatase [Terriglobales bacterium]